MAFAHAAFSGASGAATRRRHRGWLTWALTKQSLPAARTSPFFRARTTGLSTSLPASGMISRDGLLPETSWEFVPFHASSAIETGKAKGILGTVE